MKNTHLHFDPSQYTYELGVLDKRDIIWILFPYDFVLKETLKKQLKANWRSEYKNGMSQMLAAFVNFLVCRRSISV